MNEPATTTLSGRVSGDPRRGSPRVLWTAAGVSVAVHVLVIVLYPILTRGVAPEVARVTLTNTRLADGIRLVQLDEIPESAPDPLEPVDDEPVVEADSPEQPDPSATVVTEPEDVFIDPRTAAERIIPTMNHEEVWRFVDPELTELSREDLIRLQLAGTLEEWNDSVGSAAAAAEAAVDWTVADGNGGKWGVSPSGQYGWMNLHLGSVSIPIPFTGFGTNPSQMEEIRQREWEWNEIERAARSGAVRQVWKERNRAMRERRESERADTIPRRR